MIPLLGSVLLSSVLGSPHCAGMCGGFVGFYAGQGVERSRPLAHAAYNLGRLASYLALGAVGGTLGSGLDRIGALLGVARGAAVVAGGLMVLWAGAHILVALGVRLRAPAAPRALGRAVSAAVGRLRDASPENRALAIGLLSALLPCGWLYAFVAIATGTGSPFAGALVMIAFWAGTVPIMAGLGLAVRRLLGPLERRLPMVSAAVLLVMGLLTLAGKIQPHAICHERAALPALPAAGAPPAQR
jgi:sulfite exporter TauE/SafE